MLICDDCKEDEDCLFRIFIQSFFKFDHFYILALGQALWWSWRNSTFRENWFQRFYQNLWMQDPRRTTINGCETDEKVYPNNVFAQGSACVRNAMKQHNHNDKVLHKLGSSNTNTLGSQAVFCNCMCDLTLFIDWNFNENAINIMFVLDCYITDHQQSTNNHCNQMCTALNHIFAQGFAPYLEKNDWIS